MIQYQRAFDANSKTVTTADEMMQDVTTMTHQIRVRSESESESEWVQIQPGLKMIAAAEQG